METGQSLLELDPRLMLQDPVFQLTFLRVAALVMQLTFERVRLPGLIGLTALGMALGPGGGGVLPQEPILSMLGQIGLIYVMFIAGLEIDLDLVGEHRQEAIVFGGLAFAATAFPAVGGALLLGFDLTAAVLLGTLVASHTLLAHPMLMRLGLVRRLPVVTAVGGTLLTDTLALVVLLVLAAAAELIGTDEILGAFLAGICLNRPLADDRLDAPPGGGDAGHRHHRRGVGHHRRAGGGWRDHRHRRHLSAGPAAHQLDRQKHGAGSAARGGCRPRRPGGGARSGDARAL